MAEMKSPNVHARKNRNDTPTKTKTHIIKVRVTARRKTDGSHTPDKELHLTQSELVRRVLYGVNVKHTVVVAQGGEDALAALAALSAQCSKVGSNLNQLARHFNSGGKDTEQLRAQILEELSALTNFRLNAEETVGELYGNHQAFKLRRTLTMPLLRAISRSSTTSTPACPFWTRRADPSCGIRTCSTPLSAASPRSLWPA